MNLLHCKLLLIDLRRRRLYQ